MFKKIMRFIKSNKSGKSGSVCIGGDVKGSLIVNGGTSNKQVSINGKTYEGSNIVINDFGVFVDGVKQKP